MYVQGERERESELPIMYLAWELKVQARRAGSDTKSGIIRAATEQSNSNPSPWIHYFVRYQDNERDRESKGKRDREKERDFT